MHGLGGRLCAEVFWVVYVWTGKGGVSKWLLQWHGTWTSMPCRLFLQLMQLWQTEAPRPGVQFIPTEQVRFIEPHQTNPQTRPLTVLWNCREVHPQLVINVSTKYAVTFVVVYCISLVYRHLGISIWAACPKESQLPRRCDIQPN